jgi:hypothetical protein
VFPRSNSFTSGQVQQPPLQTTGDDKAEAAKRVPEAPVAVAESPVDARIGALVEAVKANADGARNFDVEQGFYMLIADMAQMPPSLRLSSLDQLVARTAMFVDPDDSDVPRKTYELMSSIVREQIRPAVAGLQFQMNAGPVDHSRRKDDLLGEIDGLLVGVPLVFIPEHAVHLTAYVSAVDARRHELAEVALYESSSGDHGRISDNLADAHAKMREIADVYLAQGYDSPAAILATAIRKYKDAVTSEDKFRTYEQLVRPAISVSAKPEDRDFSLRSADATCARQGTNDGGINIKSLENQAMDRVIDELAALFVK